MRGPLLVVALLLLLAGESAAVLIETTQPFATTRNGRVTWTAGNTLSVSDLEVGPNTVRMSGSPVDLYPVGSGTIQATVQSWDATTATITAEVSPRRRIKVEAHSPEADGLYFRYVFTHGNRPAVTCAWPSNPCVFELPHAARSTFTLTRTALNLQLPSAPTLTATTEAGRAILAWTAPETPNGQILQYQIRREVGSSIAWTTIDGGLGEFTDWISATRPHKYRVRAVNADGPGAFSNEVTVTPPELSLLGENGALYGGNKARLAEAVGVTETTLGILYGLLITIFFAGLAALATGGSKPVTAFGAAAGVIFAFAAEMFPLWVVMFVAGGVAAVVLFVRSRSQGAA